MSHRRNVFRKQVTQAKEEAPGSEERGGGRGKGKVWACSPEVEHTESSFLRAFQGRHFRGGPREGPQ